MADTEHQRYRFENKPHADYGLGSREYLAVQDQPLGKPQKENNNKREPSPESRREFSTVAEVGASDLGHDPDFDINAKSAKTEARKSRDLEKTTSE